MRKHIMIEPMGEPEIRVPIHQGLDLAVAVAFLRERGIKSCRLYERHGPYYRPVDQTISVDELERALETKTVDEIAFF